MEKRVASVLLEYQPLIHELPVKPQSMRNRATSNDDSTVSHWRETWLANIKANKARFGEFADHSVGELYKAHEHKPCIVAGSGPSLKLNAEALKDRGSIPLVSCLHNFHYFEDLGVKPEAYVSLDCQKVVLEEVSEGGSKSEDEYWEATADHTLVAYIGSDPELLERWRGKVYLFTAPLPDSKLNQEIDEIEYFNAGFSSGGNVLGSCVYLARAVYGCYHTIYVGADFSFGYPDLSTGEAVHRFHSWQSKYDEKMGKTVRVTDIFGNKVHTWPSYYNFKNFFDWLACHVPGEYWNCTEGGCLGAYPQGNISAFKYLPLKDALKQIKMHDEVGPGWLDPKCETRKILY